MIWIGHLVVAEALMIPMYEVSKSMQIFETVSRNELFVFVVAMLFGSLFPDIDEPESYIGRKLKPLSIMFSLIFRHRGFTHTLLFSLLPLLIAYIFFNDINKYALFSLYGLSAGMFAHCIGDMFTKGGIRGFLFPFYTNKRVVIMPYSLRFITNSIEEYFVIVILKTIVVIYFINNLY